MSCSLGKGKEAVFIKNVALRSLLNDYRPQTLAKIELSLAPSLDADVN